MKPKSLLLTTIISLAGALFSGYYSYNQLFRESCYIGGCSMIGDIPVSVYSSVIFLIIFFISILGLRHKNN